MASRVSVITWTITSTLNIMVALRCVYYGQIQAFIVARRILRFGSQLALLVQSTTVVARSAKVKRFFEGKVFIGFTEIYVSSLQSVRLAAAIAPGVIMTPISSLLEACNAGHMNPESLMSRWTRGLVPRTVREVIFGIGLNQLSDYCEGLF
jgi:hypothetical protein